MPYLDDNKISRGNKAVKSLFCPSAVGQII